MTWRYAAASVAGASHRAAGMPCQDRHRCGVRTDADGRATLIAVVSDGAGSARHGELGAQLTTTLLYEAAVAWLGNGLIQTLNRERVSGWLDRIRETIAHEAADGGAEVRDFAATLLFALVNETTAVFGQIGDGAIVTSDTAGEWSAQYWPKHGDYANQTYFVTDASAHDRLTFAHSLYPIEEVAIFTDGLERVLLDFSERSAHAPAFERMLLPLRSAKDAGHIEPLSSALAGYLASPAVASRADDDITLVIGTRRTALMPER